MTDVIAYGDLGPLPGEDGWTDPVGYGDITDTLRDAAPRDSGFPYPSPSDPLADAALHIKALSDAMAARLVNTGLVRGTATQLSSGSGDLYPPTSGVSAIDVYLLQCGFNGGTLTAQNYFYQFVHHGTPTAPYVRLFGSGGGASLAGWTVEYSYAYWGTP